MEEPSNDVGVRLAQRFFSAETASDKDLIFSSSFPLLKEELTGIFNINALPHTGGLVKVAEHKLGYYPFFVIQDDQGKMRLGTEWQVDEMGLFFNDTSPLFPPVGGTGNFRWTVYRLNVFSPFESANVETVSQAALGVHDPDFGFAFAKEGASVESGDLRDFTLHSRGRSPLIHSVNVREWPTGGTSESHSVTPNFSYNPIVFAFVLNKTGTTKAYNMQNGGQATPLLKRVNGTIQVQSSGNTTAKSSIIVFKDPFLALTTIEVNY